MKCNQRRFNRWIATAFEAVHFEISLHAGGCIDGDANAGGQALNRVFAANGFYRRQFVFPVFVVCIRIVGRPRLVRFRNSSENLAE